MIIIKKDASMSNPNKEYKSLARTKKDNKKTKKERDNTYISSTQTKRMIIIAIRNEMKLNKITLAIIKTVIIITTVTIKQ